MGRDSYPIVVGGCFRSGTSLVRRILDSHPRIYCGPEVKFFRDFHGDYIKDPIRHLRFMATARSMLPEPDLHEILGRAFIEMHERAAAVAKKARWADKSPENIVFLRDWERLLGQRWVFLHVARSPLDTLASVAEHEFPVSIPDRFEDRVNLYLAYNSAGLAFGDANPERYVRVVYDDLVAEPESTVRALMSALGEGFHAEQLAINSYPHQTGLEDPKVAATTSIHDESVGRWRDGLMREEVGSIVDATAGLWARLDPEGRHPLSPT